MLEPDQDTIGEVGSRPHTIVEGVRRNSPIANSTGPLLYLLYICRWKNKPQTQHAAFSNVFYTGKSSEKLNVLLFRALLFFPCRLTFRTISQCKIHWRGTACCVFCLCFQRRRSRSITLITAKRESCPRSGWSVTRTRAAQPGRL